MEIRPAREDEVGEVVAAYEWLFAPPGAKPATWDPAAAAARLAVAIESDAAAVLVAPVAGRIAGFCTVYLDIESVRFGVRALVEDLAVDEAQRSQGIGKGLLDAAKAWARGRGASHLKLESAEARVDAHRFYEREQPTWRSLAFGWIL